MRRQRQNSGGEKGSGNADWLTTFNDLVTLLMVFFVLLFTMSSIDAKQMQDFQYALQSGLGILERRPKGQYLCQRRASRLRTCPISRHSPKASRFLRASV